MRILSIITEYNPFHNGHAYQIEKAKEITQCDYCIIIMSGNFTQRGFCAIMPKHLRAQMALAAGADLVLELPTIYATASAELFAYGGVLLLHALQSVSYLSFGVEQNEPLLFETISRTLSEDNLLIQESIQNSLRLGLSYPLARQKALQQYCSSIDSQTLASFLESPNNILGIEYYKALAKIKSNIKPILIPRKGAGYHDTTFSDYASASGIRHILEETLSIKEICQAIPQNSFHVIEKSFQEKWPIFATDLDAVLYAKLLYTSVEDLAKISDCSLSLAQKIKANLQDFENVEQFIQLIKSKDITYTRIARVLNHILLNMEKSKLDELINSTLPYARILGFKESSSPLIRYLKKNSTIPIITKLADASKLLSPEQYAMLQYDLDSSALYYYIQAQKYHQQIENEYRIPIVYKNVRR